MQCHIIKNTLLHVAFSAILPTGAITSLQWNSLNDNYLFASCFLECTEVKPLSSKMESHMKQPMISTMGVPSIDLTKSAGVSSLVTTVLSGRMVTTVSNNYGSRSSTHSESDIRQSYAKISTEPMAITRDEKSPLDKDLRLALRDGTSKHVIVKGKFCKLNGKTFFKSIVFFAYFLLV